MLDANERSAVLAARPDRDGLGCHDPKPTTMMTTTPTTSSLGESCSTEVTQTFYSSSGCALSCSTGFCVIDGTPLPPLYREGRKSVGVYDIDR